MLVRRIGNGGEIQEDEGKLESPPERVLYSEPSPEGCGHRSIRDTEGVEHVGVARENVNSVLNADRGDPGQPKEFLRGLLALSLKSVCTRLLLLDPLPVQSHERPQCRSRRIAVFE